MLCADAFVALAEEAPELERARLLALALKMVRAETGRPPRSVARDLTEIAVLLPDDRAADLLEEAVRIAATVDDRSSRLPADAALAQHAEPGHAAAARRSAIDVAGGLTANRWAEAVALLPVAEQRLLWTSQLAKARVATTPSDTATALLGVVLWVPDELLLEVVSVLVDIVESDEPDAETWTTTTALYALGRVVDRVPVAMRDELALCTLWLWDTFELTAILRTVGPSLSPAAIGKLLKAAGWPNTPRGALVRAALLPCTPSADDLAKLTSLVGLMPTPGMTAELLVLLTPNVADSAAVLEQARLATGRVDGPADQARLMTEIARLVPSGQEAMLLAARDVGRAADAYSRGSALTLVARAADEMGFPTWSEHWSPLLADAATRSRSEVTSALLDAAGALHVTGGPAAISATLDALDDVYRWWP